MRTRFKVFVVAVVIEMAYDEADEESAVPTREDAFALIHQGGPYITNRSVLLNEVDADDSGAVTLEDVIDHYKD